MQDADTRSTMFPQPQNRRAPHRSTDVGPVGQAVWGTSVEGLFHAVIHHPISGHLLIFCSWASIVGVGIDADAATGGGEDASHLDVFGFHQLDGGFPDDVVGNLCLCEGKTAYFFVFLCVCEKKVLPLWRKWFSPPTEKRCGAGAKMGMQCESATLPDAVSPFSEATDSVTEFKVLSARDVTLKYSGRPSSFCGMKSEDLPLPIETSVCGVTDMMETTYIRMMIGHDYIIIVMMCQIRTIGCCFLVR